MVLSGGCWCNRDLSLFKPLLGGSKATLRSPQHFKDQTEQCIRGSVRKKNPINTKAKMKPKANLHNWASQASEIPHDRFRLIYRNCEPKNCPATHNEETHKGPHRNSVFHAALLTTRYGTPINGLPKKLLGLVG